MSVGAIGRSKFRKGDGGSRHLKWRSSQQSGRGESLPMDTPARCRELREVGDGVSRCGEEQKRVWEESPSDGNVSGAQSEYREQIDES
jgi:hypothetical protein